jgi:aspartate/methionine/tyrosine aminotransferase
VLDARTDRPRLAGRISGMKPSLYARILSKLASFQGETYPFHIGETHLLPPPEVRAALRQVEEPTFHHYGHPQGIIEIRESIAVRLNKTGRPDVTAGDVILTHGATHGLNLACQAILDPGDVMLVLSPHWPLINAMVHTASAVPVEVPFTSQIRQSKIGVTQLLEEHLQPRTRAIYLTSPNNPDGVVLTREELMEISRFCVTHDLYALVDEAYDRFHFGKAPPKLATLPGMQDRTISTYSFSKSHRMAGLRIGYAVAPSDIRDAMIKMANISIYNVSLLTQRAALAALQAGEEVVEASVQAAQTASATFCDILSEAEGVQFLRPEGGAYVFANLEGILGKRSCFDLLDDCLDEGVVFAPGAGFGRHYNTWARFCFTAMSPDRLERGSRKLVQLLKAVP